VARNLFDSTHDESDAVHSRLTTIRQFDVASVTVTGEGLNLAPVGRATAFAIQSRDIETGDVNVKVTGQRAPSSLSTRTAQQPVSLRLSLYLSLFLELSPHNFGSMRTK
jgi:hypothetical protein